ncbi:Flp family type IVb pilin [Desulfofundulus sp. TPOSR]|uniref:Flp family type IVb pilin n=1 Tax=Desulfofundulus sp. TPOSR TaxID=2714340 RepID=UPI0014087DCB|nr:Flp family type IVb pilin [Desulfofundulus sp. TPOSR]NHM28065.1 Flp family type IVb pilin [Desulfofundulus sp. TPOSR]
MLRKLVSLLKDESGSTFIESGLWIAIVVLVMATAGYNLANTMKGKFTEIQSNVSAITVPKITP